MEGSKPTFRDRLLLKGQHSDRRQLLRWRFVLLLTATTDGPCPGVVTSVMSELQATFHLICFFLMRGLPPISLLESYHNNPQLVRSQFTVSWHHITHHCNASNFKTTHNKAEKNVTGRSPVTGHRTRNPQPAAWRLESWKTENWWKKRKNDENKLLWKNITCFGRLAARGRGIWSLVACPFGGKIWCPLGFP